MSDLKEQSQVIELLDTLEKNGLHKEKNDVTALVDYVSDMEDTIVSMLIEMQELRKEVNHIYDKSLKHKCAVLVERAESGVKQGASLVGRVKDNIIHAAGNAITTFKEKGKEAFQSAVRKMKIPETLDTLKTGFDKIADSIGKDAKNMLEMKSELHEAGGHIKNAARLIFGKQPKESEKMKADKGILGVSSKVLSGISNRFKGMSQRTADLADKLRYEHIKSSVKEDLSYLKANDSDRLFNDFTRENMR